MFGHGRSSSFRLIVITCSAATSISAPKPTNTSLVSSYTLSYIVWILDKQYLSYDILFVCATLSKTCPRLIQDLDGKTWEWDRIRSCSLIETWVGLKSATQRLRLWQQVPSRLPLYLPPLPFSRPWPSM